VVIADPCKQVRCRSRAALTGWSQDGRLALLDEAACHLGPLGLKGPTLALSAERRREADTEKGT
jgi:hypothetical protein